MSRPLALSVDLDNTLSDSEGTLDAVRGSCDRVSQVAGANAAGCRSVWVNRDGRTLESSDPQPDEVVRSLADLRIR